MSSPSRKTRELPGAGKFLLEFIIALVTAALTGLLTTGRVQIALGLGAFVIGLVAWLRKVPHGYVLSLAGVVLFGVGVWNRFASPPLPQHFAGRIREVYENSLTPEQRKNLGKFVGDAYVYEKPGCQYTLFDRGLAVYFRADPETKNKNEGGRSFFLAIKEYKGDRVVLDWLLAAHRHEQQYFKPLGKDLEEADRCRVFPECRSPVSGIGSVWRSVAEVKDALGEATSCEETYWIKIQEFANGFLIVDVPLHTPHCPLNIRHVNAASYLLLRSKRGVWDGFAEEVSQSPRPIPPDDAQRLPIWTCTAPSQTCQARDRNY